MTALVCHLQRAAFVAPGLADWPSLCDAFDSEAWTPDPDWRPASARLAPRAAKRMSPQTLLAIMIAEQLGEPPPETGYVFASAIGESKALTEILNALRTPEMLVQPIRFQNAVHNAAAGQWSIAAVHRGPSTSVAAFDETVGAGLLKAGMQISLEKRPVTLIFYDAPMPEPLNPLLPMSAAIGAGLALTPDRTAESIAELRLSVGRAAAARPRSEVGRRLKATGNPCAAILPLLERLHARQAGADAFALTGGGALSVEMTPL